MNSINTFILSLKILLITAGALSIVMGIKVSVPAAMNEALAICPAILSWLKPPFLYIIVNGIIIAILASARFQKINDSDPPVSAVPAYHLVSVKTTPPGIFASPPVLPGVRTVIEDPMAAIVVHERGNRIVDLRPIMVNGVKVEVESEEEIEVDEVGDAVEDLFDGESTSNVPPELELEYYPPVEEKLMVPSGFDLPKSTSLQEAIERHMKHDTMESTWKKIMEGRHVPITCEIDHEQADPTVQKEPSSGQDELNRRIEDFINKINAELRLQRQKSLDLMSPNGALS